MARTLLKAFFTVLRVMATAQLWCHCHLIRPSLARLRSPGRGFCRLVHAMHPQALRFCGDVYQYGQETPRPLDGQADSIPILWYRPKRPVESRFEAPATQSNCEGYIAAEGLLAEYLSEVCSCTLSDFGQTLTIGVLATQFRPKH